MADTDYSIDLRTRSPFWARMASILTGGRLVTPDKGSQMRVRQRTVWLVILL
ncbi:Uncharacterised protein [Klebsiella pneumoniae]|uniref:Uncharacterized protein n=1 Tax=Klebsiella pneumoniae TaxID=573 RepID=A0A378FYY0_KLEPN|nr:Uncharacterised protein [Klebsiella pneumoniae]